MGKELDNSGYENMCFVIMPIGELEVYPKEHFKQVYEDIFIPAIKKAGYEPKRADDDRGSNMIQVNIIRDIVKAPMAICDLSTRNPNVLFELGIRQAFDLPVVLVQERGTPRIFDIGTINTIDYGKELLYREVLKDIETISRAITSTKDTSKGINSVIKLLEIEKAELNPQGKLSDSDEIQMLLYSFSNKLEKIQDEIENIKYTGRVKLPVESFYAMTDADSARFFDSPNKKRVIKINKDYPQEKFSYDDMILELTKDIGNEIK